MRWLRWRPSIEEVPEGAGRSTDFNTVQAELKVQCRWKEGGERKFNKEGETDPDVLYENAHGMSLPQAASCVTSRRRPLLSRSTHTTSTWLCTVHRDYKN